MGLFRDALDLSRRRREVTVRVRREMHGRPVAEVAERLSREWVAAGVPAPPEDVESQAAAIADLPTAIIETGSRLIRAAVTRTMPDGFRLQREELAHERWVEVAMPDFEATRWMRDFLGDFPEPVVTMRLVAAPGRDGAGRDIVVLLGARSVGVLPVVETDALLPLLDEADRRDRRVVVRVRLDDTISIGLPAA
jgi:hypothetical protein